ncbi:MULTISPECIES: caspase family protein [unclassified Moorena]|uniref:caspase family protein n=1 Tax=unclassified Moorena TaxID=2683338 RepID=UPI0013C58736|nr:MULTISPECIES: caspase family protein [unclassified Moorena]NEO19145.1 peptidase C14 [Moorena sp. SIO4A5]NEQ57265.1 peptidase C14 [Moorena sp. SIO4A1]
MGLNRRTFLQKASLGLATLGVSETLLSLLGNSGLAVPGIDRYFQVLAQPLGRKLALLVGINKYPRSTVLDGCVTDVELQQELLIHRFGFNPKDILILKDHQATRENIETAFIEHLTEQAKAGDVVVFHFSGFGSQVKLSQGYQTDTSVALQNSLVPVDGSLTKKKPKVANDLLEETLVLLLRSLFTDQVTTVLDTSHTVADSLLQGNIKVRSSTNPPAQEASRDELAFQEQLRRRIQDSGKGMVNQKSVSVVPGSMNPMAGLVLTAAEPNQMAMEAKWNGFSAGLFTYALTQYLWQAIPTTTSQVSLSHAGVMVNQLTGTQQQPRLGGQSSLEPIPTYYLPPDPSMGADGVVTAVEDNAQTAQLWLAGLPATVVDYYSNNSVLELVGANSGASQLQITSKDGLTAKAKFIGASTDNNNQLQVGQLVQEAVRVLPRNIGITVALDGNLERIERVDATSAFSGISAASVVQAGEQPADYLFGKALSSTNAGGGGYGIFYLDGQPIPNGVGEAGVAVKSAAMGLAGKLNTLLAAKLLRLTANDGSSGLGIRVSLQMIEPEQKLVMQLETSRTASSSRVDLVAEGEAKSQAELTKTVAEAGVPILPVGSRLHYQIENYGDQPIYFLLLGFNTNGNAIALYELPFLETSQTSENSPSIKDAVIAPGETLTLPSAVASVGGIVSGPSGMVEMQLICSRSPFTEASKALDAVPSRRGIGAPIDDLFNPLDVAKAVLQDIHDASANSLDSSLSIAADSYALDVNTWATLSFLYRVV